MTGTLYCLQFLHDIEFVLEADRFLLRVVLLARRQLGSELLRAHLQVQTLPGLAVRAAHAAVAGTVHVVHLVIPHTIAVLPHTGVVVTAVVAVAARRHRRRLRRGGAVAVRRVVGADGLLCALKQWMGKNRLSHLYLNYIISSFIVLPWA